MTLCKTCNPEQKCTITEKSLTSKEYPKEAALQGAAIEQEKRLMVSLINRPGKVGKLGQKKTNLRTAW